MTIGSLIQDLASLTGVSPSFFDQLKPASWKGLPFAVLSSRGRFGRKTAIHDYPFRDAYWIEDLGRGRRVIHLTGFLVGDDVIAQSQAMISACEAKNDADTGGKLVHPLLGEQSMVLLDFSIAHSVAGRLAELEFTFMESGVRLFPTAAASTEDQTATAAGAADAAASASLLSRIAGALVQGYAVVQNVIATVAHYGGIAFRLVNDATSLVKTIIDLPGLFGRFFAGATSTAFALSDSLGLSAPPSPTVAQLIASGASSRATVSAAVTSANAGAAIIAPSNVASFAAAIQAVAAAMAAAIADPADQVRLFTGFAGTPAPPSQGAAAATRAQSAVIDLWRRAALTQLARATALYQPSSYNDAAALRAGVCALLDAEVLIAGNQGEDGVFTSFRALKAAVALDLTTRGATLAPIVTVSFSAPLPAPVMAQMLYQDAGRQDELIAEANVRHPAFMPTRFQALAS